MQSSVLSIDGSKIKILIKFEKTLKLPYGFHYQTFRHDFFLFVNKHLSQWYANLP